MQVTLDQLRDLCRAFAVEQHSRAVPFSAVKEVFDTWLHTDPQSAGVLHFLLLFFIRFCQSDTSFRKAPQPDGPDIWLDSRFSLSRGRLFLALNLACYFQNRTRTAWLELLWFLLHYRGLTYTGFHLLHTFGVGPSIRSLQMVFDRVREAGRALLRRPSVYWCDNLRRHLKGFLPPDVRIDWTVVGRVLIDSLPKYEPLQPAHVDLFKPDLLAACVSRLVNSGSVSLIGPGTRYGDATSFSVPCRSQNADKYEFIEEAVLPLACGTIKGTIGTLRYLFDTVALTDTYGLAVLDYDIWWRTMKFFYTKSISQACMSVRRRIILIMGPWHIFKLLSEAIWSAYASIIFAPMWLKLKGGTVPEKPSMVEKLTFFVAIAICTKEVEQWVPSDNPISLSICQLIYRWIPLVRNLSFTSLAS
jgi:hypothetical protein